MTPGSILTVTSLLVVLLASVHFAEDVALGIEPGGTKNYNGILLLAAYLYATVRLGNRRWAHALVLLFSLAGAAVPYLHMQGVGLVGGKAAHSPSRLFWVWTLLALGVTACVSAVLAAQRLWHLRRGPGTPIEGQ
jgi:hypothetical protein